MSSLSSKARLAGLLYILASAVGVVRLMYIPNHLMVQGNAAATAGNIALHESLFRWGMVSQLAGSALWLFVVLALYRLLNDVDHGVAVLMVILGGLMQVPIFFFNAVNDAAVLMFVNGADFLSVFNKPQRDALAMLFLRLHHQGDLVNSLFWGLWLLPFGLLVYRSRFLPRFLGVWLMLACFGWLAFFFAGFLFPAYADKVFNLAQPLTLGEVATMLWLVVLGAREKRTAAA